MMIIKNVVVNLKQKFYFTVRESIKPGLFNSLDKSHIVVLITIYELTTKYNRKELIASEVAMASPLSRPSAFKAIEDLERLGLIKIEKVTIGKRTFKKIELTSLGREITELLVRIRDTYEMKMRDNAKEN